MQNHTGTADQLPEQLATILVTTLATLLPCDGLTGLTGLAGLSDELLLRTTGVIERLGRRVDGLRVAAAAEIAHRSRTDLGTGALSAKKGCRNATDLIERITLVSSRTAAARITLGAQTRPAISLTGQELPPRFPTIATALTAGTLGFDSAQAIVTTLLPALPNAGIVKVQAAEQELVAAATGTSPDSPTPCSADETRRQAFIWQMVLDQDGALPAEKRALAKRGFSRGVARDGLMIGHYAFMPDVYAKLQRVFDAYIFTNTAPMFMTDEEHAACEREKDDRSWEQQRHDVFAAIVDVVSRSSEVPTIGGAPPTVLISVRAEDLENEHGPGHGVGHIDGIDIPLSMRAVKQYLCTGGSQQVLIGQNGAILALGTEHRCFNRHQRRAINLRDGTCIIPGCHIPAYWTEIHHVRPHHDGGPTHTLNGVSLCWYHHRTIDTSGWQIRMTHGAPQVKAPPWLETNAAWRPAGTAPTQLTRTTAQQVAQPAGPLTSRESPIRPAEQPPPRPVARSEPQPLGEPPP